MKLLERMLKKVLVTLALVCGCAGAAWADNVAKIGEAEYASLAEAIVAVPTTGVETKIELLEDIALGEFADKIAVEINAGKNVVLDLAGKTISGTATREGESELVEVSAGASLTIDDSVGGGMITYHSNKPDNTWLYGTYTIQNEGSLTLKNGLIKNTTSGGASYAVENHCNCRAEGVVVLFTMTGGSVQCDFGDNAIRLYGNGGASNKGICRAVISGGTVVSKGIWINDQNAPTTMADHTGNKIELTITGGTIIGTMAFSRGSHDKDVATISGGTFIGDITFKDSSAFENTKSYVNISGGQWKLGKITDANTGDKMMCISGGVFSMTIADDYITTGYTCVANTNETTKADYPWTIGTAVAKIGDIKYPTLASAIAAVPTDGSETTITMIADEDFGEFTTNAWEIVAGKKIILDLAGMTISGVATNADTSRLMLVKAGATLTVKDSAEGGTITYYSKQPDPKWGYGTYTLENAGTLTLESGLVQNTTTNGASYAVENHDNSEPADVVFIMTGGQLQCDNGDQALRLYGNDSQSNHGKCIANISGGTIISGGIWVNDQCSSAGSASELNITGGTINGMLDFISIGDKDVINISGGTFNCDPRLRLRVKESNNNTKPYVNITGGKWTIKAIQNYQYETISSGDAYTMCISAGVFNLTSKDMIPSEYITNGYTVVANTDTDTKAAYPWTIGLEAKDVTINDNVKKGDVQASFTDDQLKAAGATEAEITAAKSTEESEAKTNAVASINTKLNTTDAQGTANWQKVAMGLSVNSEVTAVASQSADTTKATVKLDQVTTASGTGFTVAYTIAQKTASGDSQIGEAKDTPEFEVPLSDLANTNLVKYVVKATFTKTEGATTLAETVSYNEVAILKNASTTSVSIIAVPWQKSSTSTTTNKVTVADLVKASSLTSGDTLKVYDATKGGTGGYYTFSWDGSKWNNTESSSTVSDTLEVSRGQAAILTRSNTETPIYFEGEYTIDPMTITTEAPATDDTNAKVNIVASPSIQGVEITEDLNGTVTEYSATSMGDTVLIPAATGYSRYKMIDGSWYRFYTEKGRNKKVKVDSLNIPAGSGFFYLSNGGKPTINK